MGWTVGGLGHLSGSDKGRDAPPVSRLIAIIDDYKDRTGQPSDASISRAIGVARQTVSSWRTRGLKKLPEQRTLRELARLTGRDFKTDVLQAALFDAGWYAEDETRTTPNTETG
jgi:hypothetical protein